MAARADDPLAADRLCTWERALVVLAVTHHGAAAPAVLARLAAPAGSRCGAAATALLALPAAERAPALAREAARLFAPVPAGLGRLHPSWLAAALASLPPAAQGPLQDALPAPGPPGTGRQELGTSVAEREARAGRERGREPGWGPGGLSPTGKGGTPLPGSVLAWLARFALGSLCAMPPAEGASGDLAHGSADHLLATLHAAGRERVALALRHAPRSARAAFCSRLPADEAAALVRAVEAAPDDAAAARRAQADLTEVAAHAPPEVDGLDLIRRMGAVALGAAVAGAGDTPQQLAQLLPRDLGLLLVGAADAAGAGAGAARTGGAAGPPGSLPARGERVH